MSEHNESPPFAHGLPEGGSDSVRQQFAEHCLQLYRARNWDATSLSEYFAADFVGWTSAHFQALTVVTKRDIRDFLRASSVYARKGQNIRIVDALEEVVNTETSWPPEDAPANLRPPSATPARAPTPSSIGEMRPSVPTNNISLSRMDNTHGLHNGHNRIPDLYKAYMHEQDKYGDENGENLSYKIKITRTDVIRLKLTQISATRPYQQC